MDLEAGFQLPAGFMSGLPGALTNAVLTAPSVLRGNTSLECLCLHGS